MLNKKLLGSVSSAPATYVDDVFSTYLYTGNGSTQTITNDIDLAGEGGLVWCKNRTQGATDNILTATPGKALKSNLTNAEQTTTRIASFNSNGFFINNSSTDINDTNNNYVSWTFRKQPKFFDVVTYTGDGTAGRTVSHSLGSTPGMMIVKCTSASYSWFVYHRSVNGGTNPQNYYMLLNDTAAQDVASTVWNNTAPTSTEFTVGTAAGTNANGQTYVAYLFAHNAGGFGDAGTDNVISCGSFTTDGAGDASITLGYEPQWVMVKPTSASGSWVMLDIMRGWVDNAFSEDKQLTAQTSSSESNVNRGSLNATGFKYANPIASETFIYIAIRRPMKVPTDATTVFSTNLETTTTTPQTLTTGFPVDLSINTIKNLTIGKFFMDRLRGGSTNSYNYLDSTATSAESAGTGYGVGFDNNTGIVDNGWWNNTGSVWWSFRRAPGFLDVVCYTGTGTATTVTHNLGVVPELIIVKSRSNALPWNVYCAPLGSDKRLRVNTTDASQNSSDWNSTTPTSSVFSVGSFTGTNGSGQTHVAYLFATLAGVSKVGSFTHDGSNPVTVDCGFTAGARFVLIKAYSTSGDWYVFDTARGIISANDPALTLNSTSAEITNADFIDPSSSGFIATANIAAGDYIYLAIA